MYNILHAMIGFILNLNNNLKIKIFKNNSFFMLIFKKIINMI